MSHPSKAKGTRGETAWVRAVRHFGYEQAERRALHGRNDIGDVQMCPGFIAEVKCGEAAKRASRRQIVDWMRETELERVNAGADLAVLVTQRAGYGYDRALHWDAHLWVEDLAALTGGTWLPWLRHTLIVTMPGADALLVARRYGYGSPLEEAAS